MKKTSFFKFLPFCFLLINIYNHRKYDSHCHTECKAIWLFCFRWAAIKILLTPSTYLLFQKLRSATVFVHKTWIRWIKKLFSGILKLYLSHPKSFISISFIGCSENIPENSLFVDVQNRISPYPSSFTDSIIFLIYKTGLLNSKNNASFQVIAAKPTDSMHIFFHSVNIVFSD